MDSQTGRYFTSVGSVTAPVLTLSSVRLEATYIESPSLVSYMSSALTPIVDTVIYQQAQIAASLVSATISTTLQPGLLRGIMVLFRPTLDGSSQTLLDPLRARKYTLFVSLFFFYCTTILLLAFFVTHLLHIKIPGFEYHHIR